jgi:hypothetical protein
MSNASRNASRRPRIAEDLALLIALRNAIYDCQITINRSVDVINSTLDAIAFLYRLQHPRLPDAGHEHQGSAPTSSASRKITEE